MQFALMAAKNRLILLTVLTPCIAKSFLAVNLSALLSHSGMRVLLIAAVMLRGPPLPLFGPVGSHVPPLFSRALSAPETAIA
ncbi:hypothetical protein [Burkholderia pseudomallei]|uniref:hypothetical protein n=1 Tax=Burkholderia pseudomallei TaxID=28450 RepID=UPI00387A958B